MAPDPCFPEPTTDDPTVGRERETRGAFLRRSTWERARDMRRFYNENLAALPPEAAAKLCRALHRDRTEATHFELVVGRLLQILGAEVEYEAPGKQGRKVDWLAHFQER